MFKGGLPSSEKKARREQTTDAHKSDPEGKELFCYVFFSQKKDPANPRGYSQSSLVLVSRLKLVKIFHVG